MIDSQTDIGELVRETEQNFISGEGTLMSKYVTTDLYSDINKIYAYLNSKHISGEVDSQGREKPFFNIVLSARNIYYRATDIDRGQIEVKAGKESEVIPAMLATVVLQDWMKRENFGAFLNDWGLDLAGFNSSVVKFVENNGKLHCMTVPWSRLICDQVNFDANAKIETMELTEGELYKRIETHGYDSEMVENLCDAVKARTLTDGEQQDSKSHYIKLYEVHVYDKLSQLTGKDSDNDKYAQQMHVVSFVASKEKGKFDDFTLIKGRESQDPYMLTSLLPATDGSVSLDGSVKNLFESQWMMNHTTKSIKDQLDVASKLVFQTADGKFVGRNVLSAIEQGDILIHEVNMPLTQVNNQSHDITSQQSFANMWQGLSAEINGISESMQGQVAKAGTAWRQVEALLSESHSLFDLMTENKGLYIEQMLRRFIIPHLKKQLNTSKEITAILEEHNIRKIDGIYVPAEAKRRDNERIKAELFKSVRGDLDTFPVTGDLQQGEQEVRQELAGQGNQRFFKPSEIESKTWNDLFKDLEWNLEINITGESKDENAIMTTLATALTAVTNPTYSSNPQAKLIVSKILSATGAISPLEIASIPEPTPQQLPQQPAQQLQTPQAVQ